LRRRKAPSGPAAAGLGAWQYLSGPADDTNAFNPAQYNPGEVVYVAGANTGAYGSNSHTGKTGEPGSSVQVSARTIQQLERQELAERAEQELADTVITSSPAEPMPESRGAYQMGGTEGLGMGANFANELTSPDNPMGALNSSMAGMKAMIANAQQQVAGKAAQVGSGAQTGDSANTKASPTSQGALASVTPNWSRSGGGGQAFNSSFSVQDSGKNGGAAGGRNGSGRGATEAMDALTAAQQQAAGMLEGARIKGKSSFGPMEGVGANRNATVSNGGRGKQAKDDLEFFTKRSIEVAKNKHRNNTEANVFLASTQISGGMMIAAENFRTGQGQGSKDFSSSLDANLRGIGTWSLDTSASEKKHQDDYDNLKTWFWVTLITAVVTAIAIPLVKNIPVYGWWIALGLAVLATALCIVGYVKAFQYANTWGNEGFSKTLLWTTPLEVLGVWASFVSFATSLSIMGKVGALFGVGWLMSLTTIPSDQVWDNEPENPISGKDK
ncbi:MAG: hypothetical protein MJ053_05690, partial [Elusimicrobiaceae bacterium]|nr:hypothetical protein [Elusimicrobiaceae bacterium]